jgi:hypothetical protein
MTALDLFNEATRRGLQLEPRDGGKLAVIPADRCPPDFADKLRQHKRELLDLLEANRHALPPDCAPWLHVARQVLAGEFEGANGSTVESLSIGLRSIPHPRCREALARLQTYSKA